MAVSQEVSVQSKRPFEKDVNDFTEVEGQEVESVFWPFEWPPAPNWSCSPIVRLLIYYAYRSSVACSDANGLWVVIGRKTKINHEWIFSLQTLWYFILKWLTDFENQNSNARKISANNLNIFFVEDCFNVSSIELLAASSMNESGSTDLDSPRPFYLWIADLLGILEFLEKFILSSNGLEFQACPRKF